MGVFDAPALGHAEIGAFAHYFRPELSAIDAQRFIGTVACFVLRFGGSFDIGADAPEIKKLDIRFNHCSHQIDGGKRVSIYAISFFHFGGNFDDFVGAGENAATFGDRFAVVIVPTTARQEEKALAFGVACLNVGRWVAEYMAVVKRAEELHTRRQKNAVAKHIARHITDADAGKILRLDVFVQFAEMAFHRFPCAACGDAHAFVVIAS